MNDSSSALGPPKRTDLPCFVYGVLKPGELAYYQVERFLATEPVEAIVTGTLYVRDGLPLLCLSGSPRIRGWLLSFAPGQSEEAYRAIGELEPRNHYSWHDPPRPIVNPAVVANLVVGRSPGRGSEKSDDHLWSSRADPVFAHGLDVVGSILQKDAGREFEALVSGDEWNRFFRLQMAYLLLWSAIERFTALRYGAGLEPGRRVSKMGSDPAFGAALAQVVGPATRAVVDSRKPRDADVLSAGNPERAIQYYYRVRSNLSHRGKGAYTDGETVRCSLRELTEIFRRMFHAVWGAKSTRSVLRIG